MGLRAWQKEKREAEDQTYGKELQVLSQSDLPSLATCAVMIADRRTISTSPSETFKVMVCGRRGYFQTAA
jgi:hypothetical protein